MVNFEPSKNTKESLKYFLSKVFLEHSLCGIYKQIREENFSSLTKYTYPFSEYYQTGKIFGDRSNIRERALIYSIGEEILLKFLNFFLFITIKFCIFLLVNSLYKLFNLNKKSYK